MKHADGSPITQKEKAFQKYVDLTGSVASTPFLEALDVYHVIVNLEPPTQHRLIETFRIIVSNSDKGHY